MAEPCLYIERFAYRGDVNSWAARLADPRPVPAAGAAVSYNTRRLDRMAAFSVEATLEAVRLTGIDPSAWPLFGVIGLSHNGPCIYSEGFFRELVEAENPAMVSPTLFVESVLNIVPTHISLALKSLCPAYSMNIDIERFLDVLRTTSLLMEMRQFERAILCVADEFSPLCRSLFAACRDFPGSEYVDGALAVVISRRMISGPPLAALTPPCEAHSRDEFRAAMKALAGRGVGRFVLSAFSESAPDLGETAFEPSFLTGDEMERQQSFLVMRLAELLDCACRAARGGGVVLAQVNRGTYRWITLEHPG